MASSLAAVRVVLFSGGRGSGFLAKQLLKDPHIHLTLAINGYDDGASTGEVRRFLGDSLGPSDFRKNASRLALELGTCAASLVEMLDARLPDGLSQDAAIAAVRQRASAASAVADRVEAFVSELGVAGRAFNFSDCSVGNLVFAWSFLRCGRRFNAAVDDYCALVGLPQGAIENVTEGENAYLVAIGEDGAVLGSEEEIVATAGHNKIREIYLIDRPIAEGDREMLRRANAEQAAAFFFGRRQQVALNPRLAVRLAEADLIIYAPGTQHSSLFPSYMTPGLADVVARNLKAIKLLITNIQTDAEILGSSAVDIIGRALYYLNDKGRRALPTPCLITHYVVNGPSHAESSTPYVPLGQIEALEDPRLVRIANYEEGVSGRHDAARILEPFIRSLVEKRDTQRLAVLLQDAGSLNKVTQTLLEMVRGDIADLGVDCDGAVRRRPARPDVSRVVAVCRGLHGGRASPARPSGGGCLRLRDAVRIVGHVSGRRRGRPGVAPDDWAAGRRLGQPPPLRARYPGVDSLPLSEVAAVWRSQRDRQSRAEPGLPALIRPLCFRHPVGGPGGPGGRCARHRCPAHPHARESASAGAAAEAQGRTAGDSRAVLSHFTRTREAHEHCRRIRCRSRPSSGDVWSGSLRPPRCVRRLHPLRSRPTSGGRLLSHPGSSGRALIIHAAGVGSRLETRTPKFLVPVGGRSMVDWLIDLYRPFVSQVVLVVSPAVVEDAHLRTRTSGVPVVVEVQEHPTGMLDAVMLGRDVVEQSGAGRIWITWCDQVAIHPDTVTRLADLSDAHEDAAIVMPVACRREPYIHLQRDRQARIVRVLHRREGDAMPDIGEGDAGLFSLSRVAYLDELPKYARSVEMGTATGERNLLPFIPWISSRREVLTFPCVDEMEAVGINTPEDLRAVETYLAKRGPARCSPL